MVNTQGSKLPGLQDSESNTLLMIVHISYALNILFDPYREILIGGENDTYCEYI